MVERVEPPKPLGSYDEYLQENGLVHGPEAIDEYSTVLAGFREALWVARGISDSELHTMPSPIDELVEA